MADLTIAEKLALVVQAQVAQIQAEQAKQRASLLQKRMDSLLDALDRFEELHGRKADLANPSDQAAMRPFLKWGRSDSISLDVINAAADGLQDAEESERVARESLEELRTAWNGAPGETVAEWVGLSLDAIEQTVAEALKRV